MKLCAHPNMFNILFMIIKMISSSGLSKGYKEIIYIFVYIDIVDNVAIFEKYVYVKLRIHIF